MNVSKMGGMIGGAAANKGKAMAKDFDPNEIVNSGLFSLKDGGGSMKDAATGGLQNFGSDFLKALIPSPERLGGVIAVATGVAGKEAVKDVGIEAQNSGLMDQITAAKARGRRASSTAKKCAEPSCNKFHFRMDAYCADHKHLGNCADTGVESQTAQLLKNANNDPEADPNLVHSLKAIALREEMMARAETFDIELTCDYVYDAKAALGGIKAEVDDVELGQMFYQFKRLDVDADGQFTVTDFNTWIYRVDPEFKGEEGVVEGWLRKATVDGTDSFDFVHYYRMIMARRHFESNNWGQPLDQEVPMEFKQTPFWDLRMIVLHPVHKERCGWMLKRGYMMAKESLNSWKLRYMRTNTSRPYEPPTLEYWDADPNFDPAKMPEGGPFPQMKGSLPLREIVLVDFSPKTKSPRGSDAKLLEAQQKVGMIADNELVLKITLANGRRFTFACEENMAVTWAAELSRHAAASRLMVDWRENWGTKRVGKVVLRDWLNAAVVIAKIGMAKNEKAGKNASKMVAEAGKGWNIMPGSKQAAVDKAKKAASDLIKDEILTERDLMMLRIVGLDDTNIDQLGGIALAAVKLWTASEGTLKNLDNQYCYGGGQAAVKGITTAINVYNYAAAAKNSYNTNKYKVEWEPKSAQRACAVCYTTFKSMTLRKTHGKHHCRACGKVVCHVCANHRIFMSVSNKFERVCTKCITVKDNREMVEVDGNQTVFGAVADMAAHTVVDAAVTAINGDESDDSSDSGGEA